MSIVKGREATLEKDKDRVGRISALVHLLMRCCRSYYSYTLVDGKQQQEAMHVCSIKRSVERKATTLHQSKPCSCPLLLHISLMEI